MVIKVNMFLGIIWGRKLRVFFDLLVLWSVKRWIIFYRIGFLFGILLEDRW